MWFSVVCTLIDNDVRHHSGQDENNINVKENVFSERELKQALRDTLTRAALSGILSTTAN